MNRKAMLLLAGPLLAGACTRPLRSRDEQLPLQLLEASLRQANNQLLSNNEATLRTLKQDARRMNVSNSAQRQQLAQLLSYSDSIVAQSKELVGLLDAARPHAGDLLSTAVGGGIPSGISGLEILQKRLAYRAGLRRHNPALLLPSLPRLLGVDTTASALAASYFDNTTPARTVAGLTQLQAEVLAEATAALDAERNQLVYEDNRVFNRISAFACAASATVRAGELYRADLFLAGIARHPQPLCMAVDGKPLPATDNGVGKVSFLAEAAKLGRLSRVTAYWTGTIQANVLGRDTLFKVRVPYTITR